MSDASPSLPNHCRRERIAEVAIRVLRERGYDRVTWGDGTMVDIGCEAGINDHPLNVMTKVCRALRRAPDLFEHTQILGCDSRGHARRVNSYRIIASAT